MAPVAVEGSGMGDKALPSKEDMERKLAAILATELIGFTKLGSTNEDLARKQVRQVHRYLHSRVSRSGGTVVKEWSGKSVAYFDNGVDAMTCALGLRRDMLQVDGADFRIGLHVGGLLLDNGEVIGEGVNTAFGLAQSAPKNGISLSERVWEEIRAIPEFPVKAGGKRNLEGVQEPIKAYNYKDPTEPSAMTPVVGGVKRFGLFFVMLLVTVAFGYVLFQRWATLDQLTWPGMDALREKGVNPLFVPALAGAIVMYLLGISFSRLDDSRGFRLFGIIIGTLLAVPGIMDVLYYLNIFDTFPGYFEYRALHWSEMAAAGMGFLPGFFMRVTRYGVDRSSVFISLFLLIFSVGVLSGPYLQSIIQPLDLEQLGNEWSGSACQATAPSTSGACATATFLRDAGIHDVNERKASQIMFTNAKGTDPWYMARLLKAKGFSTDFKYFDHVNRLELPVPALAEVQMLEYDYQKQWITILAEIRGGYIFGDPIKGYQRMNESEIMRVYKFTGFFITVDE